MLTSVPCHYLLRRHALERGRNTAVIDGLTGEAITYGELHPRVARMAGWLASHGVGTGDRVACLALNSKAYTEFILALSWIGAVLVPLNIRHAAPELRFIIEDAGAVLLTNDRDLLGHRDILPLPIMTPHEFCHQKPPTKVGGT